jgi:hypothetical protein
MKTVGMYLARQTCSKGTSPPDFLEILRHCNLGSVFVPRADLVSVSNMQLDYPKSSLIRSRYVPQSGFGERNLPKVSSISFIHE